MDRHSDRKLNNLLRVWPKGTVAVSTYLRKHQIYRQLSDRYQQSGWIKSIGYGAFVRADDQSVSWSGGLYAIQRQLNLPIHVGAKSALELAGYGHFASVRGENELWLFGKRPARLPLWFRDHDWGVTVHYYPTTLFTLPDQKTGLTEHEVAGCPVSIAVPERAMMEYLHLVPAHNSFEEAHLLMEGLNTLRPSLVQTLLEHCNSIKVKRLFMFLAEYCRHPWVKRVKLSDVSFGSGKRVITQKGSLDQKYHITVPESFKK